MNRELLKRAIKKIVLNEMTKTDYGIGKISTNDKLVGDVKKAVGKSGEAIENPLNGKVSVDDGDGGKKYQCEIVECGEGLYDATVITHGSDRKVAKQLTAEKLSEFLKDSVKGDEKSYVAKARNKSMQAAGRDEEKDEKSEGKRVKKNDKQEDQMEEVDEETQKDIADDNTKDAEEDADKDVVAVDDENSPQQGGELVDKIERIIDRILKNKAEAKSAHLKTDPKMKSADKLTVKDKGTPALKKGK